jgi:hypothetical protein
VRCVDESGPVAHTQGRCTNASGRERRRLYIKRKTLSSPGKVSQTKKIREFLFIPVVERTGYPRRVYPGMRSARGE